MRLSVVQGDITLMDVDAIVNAANSTLLGGGGVDGAIHRAAGPELLEECRSIGGCVTGDAVITGGYDLTARHVIHTVGPVWTGDAADEHDRLLASCYSTSLRIADAHGLRSVAFPNISTGVYRFPKDRAADVAIGAVRSTLADLGSIDSVTFVCFDDENYELYRHRLEA